MWKAAGILLAAVCFMTLSACSSAGQGESGKIENAAASSEAAAGEIQAKQVQPVSSKNTMEEMSAMNIIRIRVNGHTFEMEMYDSEATQQFVKMLPMEFVMEELHGNEKFHYFSEDLSADDQEVGEIHEGDLMLYDSNCLVLFYEGLSTTYEYTPLGKIVETKGLRDALGADDVMVSFEQSGQTGDTQNPVNDSSFNFDTRTVKLNSGYEMPIYGIGTYSLLDEECVNSVSEALARGVRLIDTAYMYHNEESVGEAVRNSGIPREEIFVTTKLYPNQFANPEAAIDEALEKLDIEYIDLMLLHHPGAGDVKAYRAMEKAVAEGKIRSIGLSNWYIEELEEFLPQVTITPSLVQNEIHPYYQENEVIEYIHNLGIVVQGWYPLGGRGHTAELLGDEVISGIAESHGKSSAQVILRWNLQKGVVVIPGSSNPDHIQENMELFDFELTEEEMERINALDRNEKHDWY